MDRINRYLPILNFSLMFVLVVLGFYIFFHEKKLEEAKSLSSTIEPVITIYVVKDNALDGVLNGKNVDILSLEPLQVKIKEGEIYITKEGKWIKVDKGHIVFIVSNERIKSILGQKN